MAKVMHRVQSFYRKTDKRFLMNSAALIFPHQLFESHPALEKNRDVFLIEEYLFFRQYNFHKQKLVFHRASMKFYENFLKDKKLKVNYIDSTNELSDVRKLIPHLKKIGIKEIHFADAADNWLEKRIKQTSEKSELKFNEYPSPCFLNTKNDLAKYFEGKKKYSQTDFYIKQRKHLELLIDENESPFGGKWTYDADNRLRYPTNKTAPKVKFPSENKYYKEAVSYVEKNYPNNYGEINPSFIYPTTFDESKTWLKQFFVKRYSEFGDYEDAIVSNENILNHSLLTPMMNVGLLTPDYIIKSAIKYSQKEKVPLNSIEGFVRQIIGWREFIRGVYLVSGSYQRTRNYWNFKRKIPKSFWDGTTGIEPIDNTIKKVLKTGYCHHIERLMVLGNFMLLCEFNPNEVYSWFMELFIDAYDWVMVPNVYGMSQFSDGGIMSTKPYISGSNYLMKMSDFKKGDWQIIWDGLFWRFMHKHRKFFVSNPRMGMLIRSFDKMPDRRKNELLSAAENFLKTI